VRQLFSVRQRFWAGAVLCGAAVLGGRLFSARWLFSGGVAVLGGGCGWAVQGWAGL
jgi:hypothetical protein